MPYTNTANMQKPLVKSTLIAITKSGSCCQSTTRRNRSKDAHQLRRQKHQLNEHTICIYQARTNHVTTEELGDKLEQTMTNSASTAQNEQPQDNTNTNDDYDASLTQERNTTPNGDRQKGLKTCHPSTPDASKYSQHTHAVQSPHRQIR